MYFYLPPIKASDDQINHSNFLLTRHHYNPSDFDDMNYGDDNHKVEHRFDDEAKKAELLSLLWSNAKIF